MSSPSLKEIGGAAGGVEDPELGLSLGELGLIYGVGIRERTAEDAEVLVLMSLTTPGCPYGPELMETVHNKVAEVSGVGDVKVLLTFDPPWDAARMASEDAQDELNVAW